MGSFCFMDSLLQEKEHIRYLIRLLSQKEGKHMLPFFLVIFSVSNSLILAPIMIYFT
jgi:hypothetical protein